ncbi:MAG TPA: lytic polysaccharide monooxygenase [Pseudosphingobacterium sp.]|nr:lytic polysaccharide monooxygenase [Pseudosphingobacterium sp.]
MRTSKSKMPSSRHGHVFSPASRAYNAWVDGKIDDGALNQRESGKFFPEVVGGLLDPLAPTDVMSVTPPADGDLGGLGQFTGGFLNEPGTHWKKHEVAPGEVLTVSWNYAIGFNHRTRRWKYFITKDGWDPHQVLSRAQFEPNFFFQVELGYQPYHEHSEELTPPVPTVHEVPLPNKQGYHVLFAIWEVADSGAAFYHIIDLNFSGEDGGGERPETPKNLKADEIKERRVSLSWDHSEGLLPIEKYRITRDGLSMVEIDAALSSWTDNGVLPSSEYTYFISAVGFNGKESLPSPAIKVHTLNDDGTTTPPVPPSNLHTMSVSESSVSLMWGASSGHNPIASYHIYRDWSKISEVPGSLRTYNDNGLMSNTEYRYYVMAKDSSGLTSSPSDILTIKTKETGGGDYPEWTLNTPYAVNDKVSYGGHVYSCMQGHISYAPDWNPEAAAGILWQKL